jgi:hypothetical protein
MSKYDWSTTAADNDDADSTINWREQQPPSTVNNSARAMMAAEAVWLADTHQAITTAGSSNAYTATSNHALTGTIPDGFRVYLIPNHTNTGAATLNIDSCGAKNLRATSGSDLAAGELVINRPFTATYRTASDEFLIDVAQLAQVTHEQGGLEADVSSYDGAVGISAGATAVISEVSDAEVTAGTSTTRKIYTPHKVSDHIRQHTSPKNYIVNPGMRISQENGTSSGTASSYYPVDQWVSSHSQDGTLTFQQVSSATPGGSENRVRMTVTSADTSIAAGQYAFLIQHIEGLRTADLQWGTANATDVVLRFGFKGPAGTYAVSIVNQDSNRSFVREFTISGGDANTDTLQTLTFPGDTSGTWDKDNTISLQLIFTFATGSTYQTTADAWQSGVYFGTSSTSNGIGTTSDVFEIFDVGLYADPDSTGLAPRFELPHYDDDLHDCEYFYQEVDDIYFTTYTDSSSIVQYSPFRTIMRTTPSVINPSFTSNGSTTINSFTVTAPNNKVYQMFSVPATSGLCRGFTTSSAKFNARL